MSYRFLFVEFASTSPLSIYFEATSASKKTENERRNGQSTPSKFISTKTSTRPTFTKTSRRNFSKKCCTNIMYLYRHELSQVHRERIWSKMLYNIDMTALWSRESNCIDARCYTTSTSSRRIVSRATRENFGTKSY